MVVRESAPRMTPLLKVMAMLFEEGSEAIEEWDVIGFGGGNQGGDGLHRGS